MIALRVVSLVHTNPWTFLKIDVSTRLVDGVQNHWGGRFKKDADSVSASRRFVFKKKKNAVSRFRVDVAY